MDKFTANVIVPDHIALESFGSMMEHAGFTVSLSPEAHALVAQRTAPHLDVFLEDLEEELSPFPTATIDDFGVAG